MKKVLKLILALVVVSVLCLSVLADSPTGQEIDTSDVQIVTGATTDADSTYSVEVVEATASGASKNEAAAKAAGDVVAVLESFDVNVEKGGNEVHSGVTVNITLNVGSQYIGKYLNLYETSSDGTTRLAVSVKITAATVNVALKNFSTFTPVITDAPLQAAVSPQTSQTGVTFVLLAAVLMAALCAAYVTKRHFA